MTKFVCPLIVVKDIEQARIFYTDLLEQRIKYDFGENVTFYGDFAIHKEEHFRQLIGNREVTKESNSFELYFENDDIVTIEVKLINANVAFIHEMKIQPWQQRVIRFYDPDMHIVEIGESMENVVRRLHAEGKGNKEIVELTSLSLDFVEDSISVNKIVQT